MSQIIYTEEFIADFERVTTFLRTKDLRAAQRLAKLLLEKLNIIADMPMAFSNFGDFRLYILEFGSSGYVILYEYIQELDQVLILRIKHQKEAGF